jgi:hypothetical protein
MPIYFDPYTLPSTAVLEMYRRARHGYYTGTESRENRRLLNHCTGVVTTQEVSAIMILTRDVGHNSNGMFANPDYERCWHLSLSFRNPLTGEPVSYHKNAAREWVKSFFTPEQRRVLWVESPKTERGRQHDVWHHRVFSDELWHPILPRKEVYTKEFTELDWKTFSEIYNAPPPVMAGWGESE